VPVLKNVSPRGDLDIPLIRRTVAHGEEFEVTAEVAKLLLDQPENFVKADMKAAESKGADK
jgi:hypothetical protein